MSNLLYHANMRSSGCPPLTPHRKGNPPFLLSLCPGSPLPSKARLQSLHAAPAPPPQTPPPAPGGRFSSLTAAARGALRRHGWTHNPEPGALRTAPATPRAKTSQPLAGPSLPTRCPAREKRALLLRGKTPSSRDTSCSPPRPRVPVARDLAKFGFRQNPLGGL